MAQLFPMRPASPGGDDAHSPLVGTLLALPDPWVLLCDRRIGGEDGAPPIDVVLVHPEIGVALIDEAPRDPAGALGALQAYLGEQRFAEFYPGELPVVTLSIAPEQLGAIGDHLAAAFEAAPRLTVSDTDWADAVIELLLTPDDLPMTPVDEPIPDEEALPPEAEPEPPVEPVPEPARPYPVEIPALEARLEPMMAEWPFAPREAASPRWHRARVAAAAVGLLVLAGLGVAVWSLGGEDSSPPSAAVSVQNEAEAEAPVLPPAPTPEPEPKVAETPPPAPPPVPSVPPVVLAAKPLAPLPPAPPKPTPVEPLPQIAVSQAAPAPPPPAPIAAAPAPIVAPPAHEAPRPAPQRAVAAASRPAREARLTPARRRPAETEAGPPIDAMDLPPPEREGGAAPAARIQAAARAAVDSGLPAAPGPPAAAPSTRECRPYTAETPIAGRGVAVQGIACRDADGAWRLVSEVPLR